MGIFFKRKNKKRKIDEAFSKVYQQISYIEEWDDPKKLEHYILDSCEQIIAMTKEIEAQKAERRVVNAYLEDIATIESLPEDKKKTVQETANNIINLTQATKQYKETPSRLTDEQFLLIEQEEADMPAIIRRMMEHEKYQDQVRREKILLEGQKSQCLVEQDEVIRGRRLLRSVSIMLMLLYAMFLGLLVLIRAFTYLDLTNAFLVLFSVGVIGAFALYFMMLYMNKTMRSARRAYNHTVSLLNVVTMKYVHITKSVDYTKEKFFIRSASELNYLWEIYLEENRQKELFLRNNDDLEFFNGRLMRLLGNLSLHDRKVWLTQVDALVNPEEMTVVKLKLLDRRNKIEKHIMENREIVRSERNEIDRLMEEHQHYVPEIVEIIKSVDKICALRNETVNA